MHYLCAAILRTVRHFHPSIDTNLQSRLVVPKRCFAVIWSSCTHDGKGSKNISLLEISIYMKCSISILQTTVTTNKAIENLARSQFLKCLDFTLLYVLFLWHATQITFYCYNYKVHSSFLILSLKIQGKRLPLPPV